MENVIENLAMKRWSKTIRKSKRFTSHKILS